MNFEKCTLVELRQLAKEKGITNVSKLKKDELIEVLSKEEDNYSKESSSQNLDNTAKPVTTESNNSGYKVTNAEDQIIEEILEVLPAGYGFLRGENYLSSPKDVYISVVQIRRFKLDTADIIKGIARCKEGEKFPSLIFVGEVNGESPEKAARRKRFDELTPIYPNERIKLETESKEE